MKKSIAIISIATIVLAVHAWAQATPQQIMQALSNRISLDNAQISNDEMQISQINYVLTRQQEMQTNRMNRLINDVSMLNNEMTVSEESLSQLNSTTNATN